MSRSHLEMMRATSVWETVRHAGVYELRPERKWVWLQKLCFRALDWIGAHYLTRVEKLVYGPLDSRDLKDKVFKVVDEAMGWRHFDPDKFVIVMGRDEFMRLVCDRELVQAFSWRLDIDIRTPYSERIFDVKMAAVPWLSGISVVPRAVM